MAKTPSALLSHVTKRDILGCLEPSFLDYSASVILGRAIPDLRDGLKPCDRRTLYAMYRMGLRPDKQQRKSAAVVGEVIKSYHPHGDQSVYAVLLRMGQDFSMRLPLVDGKGNFGSPYGNSPAAAMRYTEARLHPTASHLLDEVDEGTVDMLPNFDDSTQEPTVLPARIPQLLINGTEGIAVGMATHIPPHNPTEIITALRQVLNNPKTTLDDIYKGGFQGPDYPEGGIIINGRELREMYATGKGTVRIRSKVKQETSGGRVNLVVCETTPLSDRIPYIESVAKLVKDKVVESIYDVTDESGREADCRIVIALKKDADPDIVLHKLWKLSELETTISYQFLVIDKKAPVQLGLVEILARFLDFRRDTIRRRTHYRLDRAQRRLALVTGYLKAIDLIRDIVKIIENSDSTQDALKQLITLGFTQEQAESVLELRLRQLMRLEKKAILDEQKELDVTCRALETILKNPSRLDKVIDQELEQIALEFAPLGKRRTEIKTRVQTLSEEDLIPDEDVDIWLSHDNYLKRCRRTGKDVQDVPGQFRLTVNQRKSFFIITSAGRVLTLPAHTIPEYAASQRGKALAQIIDDSMPEGEYPLYLGIPEKPLLLVASTGKGKLLDPAELPSTRRKGIPVFPLGENGRLLLAAPPARHLSLVTAQGKAIRISTTDIPVQGRGAAGVTLIKLTNDTVVGVTDQDSLLLVGKGAWKAFSSSDLPIQGRGGQGVKAWEQAGSLPLLMAGSLTSLAVKTDASLVDDRPSLLQRTSKAKPQGYDLARLVRIVPN